MSQDERLSHFKKELAQLIGKYAVGLEESSLLNVLEEYTDALGASSSSLESPTSLLQPDSSAMLRRDSSPAPLDLPTSDNADAQPRPKPNRAAVIRELKERRARRNGRSSAPLNSRPPTTPTPASTRPLGPAAPRPTGATPQVRLRDPAAGPIDPRRAPAVYARTRSTYTHPDRPELADFQVHVSGMLFARRFDFAFDINKIPLSMKERILLDFDLLQPRSFENLLRRSLLDRTETTASLAAMEAIGLVDIKLPGLDEARSTSGTEIRRDAIHRIQSMENRLTQYDAFGIFGVHWTAHDLEIARRYKVMSAHFKHLNQPLGIEVDHRTRLKAIRRELAVVHDTLSDANQRRRLRLETISPADLLHAARTLEALGTSALRKKSFHRALDCFQRLLELDPKHPKASRLLPTLLARASHG